MSLGEIRLHGHRLGNDGGGNVRLARLQGDHPKQMQGDGLVRVGLEDTLTNIPGLGQAPRHVVLAALVEGLIVPLFVFAIHYCLVPLIPKPK
ncbi:MAG: hypothetical protein VCD33_12715 [Alphaproteobacteria bacterium]